VEAVDPTVITALTKADFIPVIAPVGVDEKGHTYNVNADLVAGKVAAALSAEKLILLTDVEGVLDADRNLMSALIVDDVKRMIQEAVIQGGMIPKIECCVTALREGVKSAHIIDGRVPHAVLLEIFTDVGIGTQITRTARTGRARAAREGR
jgi:acetylglutamate kinase